MIQKQVMIQKSQFQNYDQNENQNLHSSRSPYANVYKGFQKNDMSLPDISLGQDQMELKPRPKNGSAGIQLNNNAQLQKQKSSMKPPRAGGLHEIPKNGSNLLKGQYDMVNQFGIQNRAMSNSLQQQ